MKKVAPILKPIALLTISTIVATATGVVNSQSYRSSQAVEQTTVSSSNKDTTSYSTIDETTTFSTSPKMPQDVSDAVIYESSSTDETTTSNSSDSAAVPSETSSTETNSNVEGNLNNDDGQDPLPKVSTEQSE